MTEGHGLDDHVLQRHLGDTLLVVRLQRTDARHHAHHTQSVILVESTHHAER